MGNSLVDINRDGRNSFEEWITVLRGFLYIGLASFAILIEGISEADRFTNFEMGLIVACSFGAAGLEMFLKNKPS